MISCLFGNQIVSASLNGYGVSGASTRAIPSPVAGKVTAIVVPEGETAEVGDVLVELEVAEGCDR